MGAGFALWARGAVVSATRPVALFPFSEADVAWNRSRKSFALWQCEVGGAALHWLAGEFSSRTPIGPDTPLGGCYEHAMSGLPHPSSSPCPSHPSVPYTPFFPLCRLSHIVYYGLKCDSQHGLSAGVPLWQLRGFFWRAPCVLVIWGQTGCGHYPLAMTVDLFALLCALVITSSAMEGK